MRVMGIFFWAIFIYVIVVAVKNATKRTIDNNYNNGRKNTSYQTSMFQRQPDKYKTINSHYSQATLQGTVNSKGNVQSSQIQKSPLAGQFVASNAVNEHNHAYEHKVEPIDEATVHDMFEDRKEAYRERKAQMKADLPKTSYSQVEQKIKSSNDGKYRNIQRNSALNGDNGYIPNRSEKTIKCSYCGANNIIPWNANVKYSCYFCREEL